MRSIIKSLKDSELQYRRLFEAAQDGILILDAKTGMIEDVNPYLIKMLGYSREEFIKKKLWEVGAFKDVKASQDAFEALKENEYIRYEDLPLKAKGGGLIQVEFVSNVYRLDDEKVIQCNIRDITARKQSERALRESEKRYRNTLDNMLEGCQIIGFDWRYLYVNDAVTRHGHRTKEELLGHTMMEIYPGIEKTDLFDALRRCLVDRVTNTMENEFTYPDGTTGFFELGIQPVPEGVFILSIDITERKQAEEQLRQNATRALAMAEISELIARASLDDQAILEVVTHRVAEVLGDACVITLTSEDGELLHSLALYHPEPEAKTILQDLLTSKSVCFCEETIGRVAQSGQPILIKEVPQEQIRGNIKPEYRQYLDRHGVYSILIVPLSAQGRVIGTLGVTRDQPGKPYTEDDLKFLREIGEHTTLAITNVRLFQQEQAHSQELKVLNSLSSLLRKALTTDEMLPIIVREIHQLLHSDSVMVSLRNQGNDHLKIVLADGLIAPNTGLIFPSKQDLSGIAFDSRQPIVTSDYAEEPERLPNLSHGDEIGPAVFVPLQSEVEMLGVLMAARHRGEGVQPFSSREVHILATIGEMLGNSLRRARLFEEANRRLNRMQGLRKIDVAIISILDLKISIDIILEQITAQMGVEAACVLLFNTDMQKLKFAAGRGFRTDALEYTNLRIGEGYAGRAAMERRILNIPDLRKRKTDFLRSPAFGTEGFIAYYAIPLIAKDQLKGVLEIFHRTPLEPDQEWLDFLETLAGQAAIAIDNASLFADLQNSNLDLVKAYDDTIVGWSHALDLRDKQTEGHTLRVTVMTLQLAQAMDLSEAELIHLRRGALLHDIGKMGIPDHILLKPGLLTEEEWVLMRKHPVYAYEMLAPIDYLKPALGIPRFHHEKWDGSGYPHGLKGEQIPLDARIFAVVDVWDALISDRPYRNAWTKEKALEHIRELSGNHFDPRVVEAFLRLIEKD